MTDLPLLTGDEARTFARRELALSDRSFSMVTLGMTCLGILGATDLTLADCEVALRTLGSKTHLVAWPRRFLPPGVVPRNPSKPGAPVCDHALWICLHGEDERIDRLKDWGIADAAENLRLLADTGFSTT